MPPGTPFWYVVLPSEKINYVTNPSFELGTTGYDVLIAGGTVGSISSDQAFGAWSGSIVPAVNGTAGVLGPSVTLPTGTYTLSAYVKGAAGVNYMLAMGDSSGANLLGSALFVGGGTWARYSVPFVDPTGASRRFVIRKNGDASVAAFYVDGAQIEAGSVTTYLDGDQDGCTWNGDAHRSQSYRSAQARQGGTVVSLASLGFTVDESPGIGMPHLQNTSQGYAIIDGASYQRTRTDIRTFSLTSVMSGTSWADMHTIRRRVIDALKIDRVTPQQPTRFLYTGAGGTSTIDAVYDTGMEFATPPDSFSEQVSVGFVSYSPYWQATTDQGTALPGYANLGTVSTMLYRDRAGKWGTMPDGGIGGGFVQTLTGINGTVFLAGSFATAGGTLGAKHIAQFANGRFGTLTNGTLNNQVTSIGTNAGGTVFIGGNFTDAAGTLNASNFVFWNGGFGSVAGGGPGGNVYNFAFNNDGTVFMTSPTGAGFGGGLGFFRYHNGAAYQSSPDGTLNGPADITLGLNGTIYLGGFFTVAGALNVRNLVYWSNGFGSLGTTNTNALIFDVATGPSGLIFAGGSVGSIANNSGTGIMQFNGVSWSPLGSGVFGTVNKIRPQPGGALNIVGQFTAINGNLPTHNMAVWTGATWLPGELVRVNGPGGILYDTLQMQDGTQYVAGSFAGTYATPAFAVNWHGTPVRTQQHDHRR